MSSEFLKRIEEELRVSLFTDQDLRLVFKDKVPSAIYNSLTYHLKNRNLERYRRGLYSLSVRRGERLSFSKFKLANKLVLQSYVSFESALSHHGLIPEAVYEVASATMTKNVVFENSLGRFSFSYSPVEPFYLGVEKDEVTGAKIANPVRALFDLVNTRKKLYASAQDLESDFRVDLRELKTCLEKFRPGEILELGELYKKKTTRTLAMIIVRDLM
jgi:hypothetical protein